MIMAQFVRDDLVICHRRHDDLRRLLDEIGSLPKETD